MQVHEYVFIIRILNYFYKPKKKYLILYMYIHSYE